MKLSASILNADFTRLGEEISAAEAAGCDEIHVDVMDGRFVETLSLGLPVLEAVAAATSLPIDAHMMVHEPARFVESYAAVGATMMTVHVEACADLPATIESIRAAGMTPAVSLNPPTPLESIDASLTQVARVLVMTVVPGKGGQSFMRAVLPKLQQLATLRDERGLELEIAVDGGIKAETAGEAVEAGAEVLVSGTGIFRHPGGVAAGAEALRSAGSQLSLRSTPTP